MARNSDENVDGRLHGEQFEPEEKDSLILRLVFMLIIAAMLSLAQTVLGLLALIQFIIMVLNGQKPNERLSDFGTDLGIWMAKAARYQTAGSNVKPWPWTELD